MKHLLSLLILLYFLTPYSKAQNPKVVIATSKGNIELEIYESKAPITAKHFLSNVDQNVFKDACFYRVVRMDNQPFNQVKIEVIQGGLFQDSIVDKMPVIPHETTQQTGILHRNGVISMARSEPGTASTEFFICVGDQPELDYMGHRNPDGQGFATFGKVTKGMEVVRAIQQLKDQEQMLIVPVKIYSITRK
ncbi:peptidylprolyl isomerase [Ancylomarina longa]|uniref:peptidylprolyl isomerase n=1 Tax=Ancylomarina longa TaxID=2487017 RepID=A0A434AG76_9BACT|nr:peptidylprolyl isomerase [Ancylomarina longa]RUT73315.1 peptidylprolyl isomerase [Ancylomarina longa]